MSLINILYEFGEYGPVLLMVLSFYLLWNNVKLLTYYCIGLILNLALNVFLKLVIQHPRPCVDEYKFELLKRHYTSQSNNHFIFHNKIPFEMFGMPSGHAQMSLFSTVFIFFSLDEKKWLVVYLLSSLLTCYQRVALNYHSIVQVLAGSTIGATFAWIVYLVAREKIKGRIRPKRDDDAVISLS